MNTITVDFDKIPRLNLDEIGGEVTFHKQGLGTVQVGLGDDNVLRIDQRPVGLYRHWRQSNDVAQLLHIAVEMTLRSDIVNASLAQTLYEHPEMIPFQWLDELECNGMNFPFCGGGIIFWGTTVFRNGKLHYVSLKVLDGKPLIVPILSDRLIGRKHSVILVQ